MHAIGVVGLFESKGEADNASHRLVTEGINEADIAEQVLREHAPPPTTMGPELISLFGDLRKNYASYITNGETLLWVRVPNDEQAEAVESILMMFEPVQIDRLQLVTGRLVF